MERYKQNLIHQIGNKNQQSIIKTPIKNLIKCKDCELECNWKKILMQEDENHECPMLDGKSRTNFAESQPVTPNNIEYISALAISLMREVTSEFKLNELATFQKCVLEHKKAFYPEIQRQAVMEIDKDDSMSELFKIALEKNGK